MKRIVYLTLIVSSIAMGCSKKDDTTITTSSKTSLLIKADWLATSIQYKQQSATTWTDKYPSMASYEKDNHIIFKADGTYEVNEGATRNSPADPFIIETGTWKFAQNETLLIIAKTGSTSTQDVTIDTLDGATLSFSYSYNVAGTIFNYKESYGH